MNKLRAMQLLMPKLRFGLAVGSLLIAAGCQTASIDDLGVTAPQSLTLPTPTAAAVQPTTTSALPTVNRANSAPTIAGQEALKANKAGNYPKIGRVQVGQTAQLTNADKNALRADLRNSRKTARERSLGENFNKFQTELQRLRKQAKNHGEKSRDKKDNLTDAQKELKKLREMRKNHGKDALKKIEKPTG